MLNLLFISSSPRAELLRSHFQHILKMRIEVVGDFDHGLKDVFEKRPVAVCIQDQIAGVTGESVARHIQLLLGKGAPGFILMHEGSAKARAVPGLFSHLIDLAAPFDVISETLCKALKSQLGEHWDMVYSGPLQSGQHESERVVKSSLVEPLVDDFITENTVFDPKNVISLPGGEPDVLPALETLIEHDLPGGPPAERHAARIEPPEPEKKADYPEQADPVLSPPGLQRQMKVPDSRQSGQRTWHVPVVPPAITETAAKTDDTSIAVEELLQAFEANYRSRKRLVLRVLTVVLVVLASSLVLFWMKRQGVVTQQQKQTVQPVVSSVKAPAQAVQPAAEKQVLIPSFIPKSGYDSAFSSKNTGWTRYLAEKRDYRLFHMDGRLQALQVLVVGSSSIAPLEVKQALLEITGSGQYRTGHKVRKGELWVEVATVPGHADLLIYRSASNGPIKAFVLAPHHEVAN